MKSSHVDDQDAVGLQVLDIHFQRGGIHGDQHVHGVAGRVDVARRKLDLESADAGKRARRGANFGREIRERGQIVAVQRDGIGELAAGDLHAVAGVAAEADNRRSITSRLRCGGRTKVVDIIACVPALLDEQKGKRDAEAVSPKRVRGRKRLVQAKA